MKIIILLVLISLFLYLGKKKPVLGFWIALSLYFNPAGLITYYMSNPIIGPLLLSDLMFLCMLFCFFNSKIQGKIWKPYDKSYKSFFYYLCFLILYYYIVVLCLVPLYFDRFDIHNLIKGRKMIWGVFIGLMVYKEFLWYGYKIFFQVVIWNTIIGILLFMISMLGIDIVPIIEMKRYQGENLLRYSMLNYGLMTFILYTVWVIILLNNKLPKLDKQNYFVYFAFGLYIVVGLLTLTRRTYLNFLLLPIILFFILSYVQKKSISIQKVIIPFIIIVFLIGVFSPKLLQSSSRIVVDTFQLVFTGTDTRGEENYRINGDGDLLLTKQLISESPIFGQGYYYFNYGLKYDSSVSVTDMNFMKAQDAAYEVPIYSVFFQRGWLGFLLYIPIYFMLFKFVRKSIFILRNSFKLYCHIEPLTIIFSIVGILYFIQSFTINIYNLFGTFTEPMFMIYCSIIFSSFVKLKRLRYE